MLGVWTRPSTSYRSHHGLVCVDTESVSPNHRSIRNAEAHVLATNSLSFSIYIFIFIYFLMYVNVFFCHKMFVQRSEFNSG